MEQRYSLKRYIEEKYGFSREIAYQTLNISDRWKSLPRFNGQRPYDSKLKKRVLRKKHRWITEHCAGNMFRHGIVQIMQIDFILTTYCSLNCKNCSEWIPYLEKKKMFTFEELRRSIDSLFKYTDYVQRINLIGETVRKLIAGIKFNKLNYCILKSA